MTHAAAIPTVAIPTAEPVRIPVREIAPYAIFAGVLFLVVMYFISTEQGALALFSGMNLHEFVHDGRHLLGFPCH